MFINPPGPGELYIPPGLGALAGLVLVVVAALVTRWVLTRDLDDPDARAERYRDRPRPRRSAMKGRRTPTWWIVRFELAVGIGLTLLVGQLAWNRAMNVCFGGGCYGPPVGPMPMLHAVLLAALAVAVAGLVWMVRIIRCSTDESARWRYRDR
jgi:hypothetical protein